MSQPLPKLQPPRPHHPGHRAAISFWFLLWSLPYFNLTPGKSHFGQLFTKQGCVAIGFGFLLLEVAQLLAASGARLPEPTFAPCRLTWEGRAAVVPSYPQADSSSHPLHNVNLLFATAKSLYSWKGKSGSIYSAIPVPFLGVFSHHIPPLSAFARYSTKRLDPFKMLEEKAWGRKGTCTSIYQIWI